MKPSIKSLNLFLLFVSICMVVYYITNQNVEKYEYIVIEKLDEIKKDPSRIPEITTEELEELLKQKRIAIAEVNDDKSESPNSKKEDFGFYYPIYNTPMNNIWYSKLRYYNQGYGWVPYDYRYNSYPTRRYLRPDLYIQPFGKGRWVRHYGNYYYAF
jgi:hypothetical protein